MRARAAVHYSDLRIEYPNLLAASYVLLCHLHPYAQLIFCNTHLFHVLRSFHAPFNNRVRALSGGQVIW